MSNILAIIFFFYGLAFFSMGLAILLEVGRATDERLQHALTPLALFGLIHGGHEWLEMFQGLELLPLQAHGYLLWESFRLIILALSFISLGAFGASLLSPDARIRKFSLVIPLFFVLVWALGLLAFRSQYSVEGDLWDVADVWTRYVLAVPSAVLACAGLISLFRSFREGAMSPFARDSLLAAVAFAWYGIIGQTFTRPSPLPPSHLLNGELFIMVFGFPVQLLRATAAIVVAIFVMRFLRSFEVETQQKIDQLRRDRLQEAERSRAMRGELLRRVVAAQESERQRIARELHDETGQALTAIGMGLRGALKALPEEVGKAEHNLSQLEKLTARSLVELQRLIAGLRPSHLDDLGLAAALRWYAGQIEQMGNLRVELQFLGEEKPITSPLKTELFRVAQEALTNVVKHANASNVRLRLAYGPDTVQLQVEDDGEGFDTRVMTESDRPSWGLIGIQERVAMMGGNFQLSSRIGSGTRIEVTIPYKERMEAEYEHQAAPGG